MNRQHKNDPIINDTNKNRLDRTAEFLTDAENRKLLDTNQLEDLYAKAKKAGVFDYDVSVALCSFHIDILPYVKRLRGGMVDPMTEELVLPDTVEEIEREALAECCHLQDMIFGRGIRKMEHHIFSNVSYNLTTLVYQGTRKEWENIEKDVDWASGSWLTCVECGDGAVIDVQEEYESKMTQIANNYIKENFDAFSGDATAVDDAVMRFHGDQEILISILKSIGIDVD